MISRTEKNKKIAKKINNYERKEKTSIVTKILIKIILITFIIMSFIFLVLRYVGTYGLFVREYSKEYNNLPKDYYGLKIVHFSDLYYGSSIKSNELKKLTNKINELKPDIVIFTGGLVYSKYQVNESEIKSIRKELQSINTTMGKYFVTSKYDDENIIKILEEADFINMDDKYELMYNNSNIPILLVGYKNKFDSNMLQYEGTFTISITHNPDNTDEIINSYKTNIILAGNSLNGQIRLPNKNNLITFEGSKKYYNEYYNVNDVDLYITNGLGENNYPFRLINHPSINLFRLK